MRDFVNATFGSAELDIISQALEEWRVQAARTWHLGFVDCLHRYSVNIAWRNRTKQSSGFFREIAFPHNTNSGFRFPSFARETEINSEKRSIVNAIHGESVGVRTQDLLIKSQLLNRLSALWTRLAASFRRS